MTVISPRLDDRDLERLDELSKLERKDRSTAARELFKYGWEFLMFKNHDPSLRQTYTEGVLALLKKMN